MRSRGDVIQVKVLGIMALIDEGNFSTFCFVVVDDYIFLDKESSTFNFIFFVIKFLF